MPLLVERFGARLKVILGLGQSVIMARYDIL